MTIRDDSRIQFLVVVWWQLILFRSLELLKNLKETKGISFSQQIVHHVHLEP